MVVCYVVLTRPTGGGFQGESNIMDVVGKPRSAYSRRLSYGRALSWLSSVAQAANVDDCFRPLVRMY
jgi:hypothetical protein